MCEIRVGVAFLCTVVRGGRFGWCRRVEHDGLVDVPGGCVGGRCCCLLGRALVYDNKVVCDLGSLGGGGSRRGVFGVVPVSGIGGAVRRSCCVEGDCDLRVVMEERQRPGVGDNIVSICQLTGVCVRVLGVRYGHDDDLFSCGWHGIRGWVCVHFSTWIGTFGGVVFSSPSS